MPLPTALLRTPFLPVLALLAATAFLSGCQPDDSIEAIRQQQARGEWVASLEPLRERLAENPDDGELNFLYGRALIAVGELGAATFPLSKAMESDEWRRPAAMERMRPALSTTDFNEVVDVTNRLLEDDPDDVIALLYRAQANAYWKKNFEAALEDARRVLELEPDRIEAYEPLVLALEGLDRDEEARAEFAEVGRRLRDTDAPEAQLAWHCVFSAAFAVESIGFEESRSAFDACLETYPADPTVVQHSVEFYDAHGDLERSLEILETVYEQSEEPGGYRLQLASRLAGAGRRDEGEALLSEASDVEDPRRAYAAWLERATFLQAQGEQAAVADAFESAIEALRPVEDAPPLLLFQWADALVLAGEYDRALEVADRIPVPAQRHLIQGRVAQQAGDHAEALGLFDKSLAVWPNNAPARYFAGIAAETLGDFDRALEEFRYSIRIDAAATDARTRAAKLFAAQGDLRSAYQTLFLQPGKPLETEGRLFLMYLLARAAIPAQLQDALMRLGREQPALYPAAVARGAEGAAKVAGPQGGLGLLVGAPGIDYRHPGSAPALRELVRFSHQAGQPRHATQAVAVALAAQPEAPEFQEIHGLHLELSGADPAEARAAYERALEGNPGLAGALMGLARLTLESDLAAAAQYFVRAYDADPTDPLPQLAVARILLALGRKDEAIERLKLVLEYHPLEPQAAERLTALALESGEVSEETLAWATRATRLAGSVDDFERLSRVHEALGNAEQGAQAASKADQLREVREELKEGSDESVDG